MTTLRTIELKRMWFIYRLDRPTEWRDPCGEYGRSPAPTLIEERAREVLASGVFATAGHANVAEMEDGTWMIEIGDEHLGVLYRLEEP